METENQNPLASQRKAQVESQMGGGSADKNQSQSHHSGPGVGYMILALVVIVVAVIFLATSSSDRDSNGVRISGGELELTEFPDDQLPTGFPSDLPLQRSSGAVVVSNFSSETEDGRTQATRSFNSELSMEENLQLYLVYLDGEQWRVTEYLPGEEINTILATNDEGRLTVNLSQRDPFSPVLVEMNYTF